MPGLNFMPLHETARLEATMCTTVPGLTPVSLEFNEISDNSTRRKKNSRWQWN